MKRAALIGHGMVADTHLAALRDASGVSLCGVLGRDKDRAAHFAARAEREVGHPVHVFTSIEELAGSGEVDLAIVTTPPDARGALITALAEAGKPVLIEKPIERTYSAAQEIVALCETRGVPLGVVLQHRAREASLALKSAVDGGVLGELVSIEIRVPWWRDQGYYDQPGRGTYARDGGGVLITQAIHALDLALWISGPLRKVQAKLHLTKLHRMEAEDWAGAVFETEGGAVGTLVATTASFPGEAESLRVQGTKAAAHLASGVLTLTPFDGAQQVIGAKAATGSGADPMAFTHAWHQAMIEDFARCLVTGADPLASGRSALMAHAAIDAMERSSATRAEVEVSLI